MSYYYKYNFISPEPTYARVKEELRSYFDTGAVDDTMFPLWTDDCLLKLGKLTYPIAPAIINVQNSQGRLPDDFKYMREAWMCSWVDETYQLPNSLYEQVTATTCQISTRIDNPDVYCDPCSECNNPNLIRAVYKTTETVAFQISREYLLTPGNISTACPRDLYCANLNSVAANSYDIRGNKLILTCPQAIVYILYYSSAIDDNNNQLIPDDSAGRFRKYIELYIKSKVFEQIWNQTTDETFNQSAQKYQAYKQMADEAFILADIESKKEDIYRIERATNRVTRRNRKYLIR